MEEVLFQLLVFGLAVFALIVASRWIVVSSKKIAGILKLSEFSVGFIFLALATSLPELVVSVTAAFEGAGQIVVGNVLGSNIANILLILGISAIIANIKLRQQEMISNVDILLFLTVIPLFLLWKGSVGSFAGMILILLFVFYIFLMTKIKPEININHAKKSSNKIYPFLLFGLGVIVLVFSANILISSAVNIATTLNVSQTIIGLTIVAVGTSIGELIVSVQAMRKKSYALALGNIFGSCIINLTLVLGAAAVIREIVFDYAVAGSATFLLVASTIALSYLLTKHRKLDRKYGVLFVATYAIFIIVEVLGIPVFYAAV